MKAGGPLVELVGVRYRYRSASIWAVGGVSGTIGRGIILGLVGPNGSGKTTLFKLILGFLRPTEGRVSVAGMQPGAYRMSRGIGYLPEAVRLPEEAKVTELASYAAHLSGLSGPAAAEGIRRLMDELELTGRADDRVATLSHGYRQRVGLLIALLGDPALLLLDEPANGLDPHSLGILRSQLRWLKRRNVTVVVSSHNLLELERVCDEVLIMRDGEVLGRSSRAELASRPDVWVVQVGPELALADGGKASLGGPDGVRLAVDEIAFDSEEDARSFAAGKPGVESIERRPFDLELLFHSLLQKERAPNESNA